VPSEIPRKRSSGGYDDVIVVATPLDFYIQSIDYETFKVQDFSDTL
jgi:hypothetical protein